MIAAVTITEDCSELSGAIVSAAERLIGTPFHHAARVPGVGVDCSGLLCCVAKEIGYPFNDVSAYSPVYAIGLMRDAFAREMLPVETASIGDVLLFNSRLAPGHCGIYVGGGQMIHAHYRRGVLREALRDYWRGCLVAAFRMEASKPCK